MGDNGTRHVYDYVITPSAAEAIDCVAHKTNVVPGVPSVAIDSVGGREHALQKLQVRRGVDYR